MEVRNEGDLMTLKSCFIQESGMNFTHELSIDKKLPLLDVLVNNNSRDKYAREVYTKPTKKEECINYDCDAPERYKTGVIKTLLNRAYRVCNSEEAIEKETSRVKKLLINNNFPNRLIEKVTKEVKAKHERHSPDTTASRPP